MLHPVLRLLSIVPVLLLAGVPGAYASSEPPGEASPAERAIHLLDYIAVDYPGAVQAGRVVSELEYQEQVEFVGQVEALIARAAGSPELATAPLGAGIRGLRAAIESKAPADRVASEARTLAGAIRETFRVAAAPRRAPSLERGQKLYLERCATCHGAEGRGDGPGGVALDPRPTDFTNRERAFSLAPVTLYSTISFGIQGTGMAGFAAQLSEQERWDLAFYVGSLAFSGEEVEAGARVAGELPNDVAPDLETLATTPPGPLARSAGDRGLAVVAYLRTHPEALEGGDLPVERALARLEASWQAYQQGEAARALDLAISAYLDGFEPAEPALDAVDRPLRERIEERFIAYRAGLRQAQPADELAGVLADLRGELVLADARLGGEGLGFAALFAGALSVLIREGLEAVLVLVAIGGVLLRTGRREAMPYFHAGWIGALALGGLTWVVAQTLIEVSGAEREVIEGITSLLATAILFYVSYWLLARLEAARWQVFIESRVKQALSRGSRIGLATISFVAVYREIFEMVLFLEALRAQAAAHTEGAVGLGALAGLGSLGLLLLGIYRLGLRIPMRWFFGVTSALLYLLAFTLAGEGIAALQEAGWVPLTPVAGPRFPWLGVYPTWEGLAVQALLVAAALAAVPLSLRRPATVAALLGLCLLPSPGCGPKVARETVVSDAGLRVLLRERPEAREPGAGFAHPAVISAVRVAAILSRIDVRPREGDPHGRRPAIPTELLMPVSDGVARALSRARPDQEVVVMARRQERRLGIFTKELLTSFVTFVRGDRLEVHLSRLDWPVPGDADDTQREPRPGEREMGFRVVRTEGLEPIAPQAVAAVWRDPLFQDTRAVRTGPGGQIRRRIILMESPEESLPPPPPPGREPPLPTE